MATISPPPSASSRVASAASAPSPPRPPSAKRPGWTNALRYNRPHGQGHRTHCHRLARSRQARPVVRRAPPVRRQLALFQQQHGIRQSTQRVDDRDHRSFRRGGIHRGYARRRPAPSRHRGYRFRGRLPAARLAGRALPHRAGNARRQYRSLLHRLRWQHPSPAASRNATAVKRAFLPLLLAAAAHAALSDHIVAYRIRAQLDPALKTVTAHETLTWRNTSPLPVGELRFHLYLNAFQNEKSTFMRESGGRLRGASTAKDAWGYIEVQRMRIAGGADLTGGLRFVHPDDDNADDQSVAAVSLPQPVAPGASITLDIDFLSRLPKVFARTGYHNDFFMVGQWFPKIGVYENGAWNCHQFHATTEFFADYGVFDVTLTVPSDYVVGATGVQQSVTEDAARHQKTVRFYQEDVHDFAWTASPHFIRTERAFGPNRVRMILLMQPEHAWQTGRHYRALENGLKWFGQWYGAYPYQTITLVDPPYGG